MPFLKMSERTGFQAGTVSVFGFQGCINLNRLAWWLSWLERRPVTAEVVGSNPIRVVNIPQMRDIAHLKQNSCFMDGFPSGQRGQTVNLLSSTSVVRIHPHPFFLLTGVLAQLGEHLPYKQGVTGSSPVGPIRQSDAAISCHYISRGGAVR